MSAHRGSRLTGAALLAAALIATVAVIGSYLALGGASYKPLDVADPCDPRAEATEDRGLLEDIALSALDGAACSLRVPREELALALATPESRVTFGDEYNLSDEAIEAAVETGLDRAISDAQDEGRIGSFEAGLLRSAADAVPTGLVIDALQTSAGKSVLEVAEDLLRNGIG
jgi:hypothetical protein